MPCPCSTVAIASWEIRLRFALCPPSLSCLRRIRVSLSSSGDGTRVNSKGGQNSEGNFRRRRRGTPGEEKRGCERIDPKIPNRKLQCRLPVGMWILSSRFLMANGFFISILFIYFLSRESGLPSFFGIKLGTNRRWRAVKIFNMEIEGECVKRGK